MILESDLRYSDRVTAEESEAFAYPAEVIYRFRKTLGEWFEEEP